MSILLSDLAQENAASNQRLAQSVETAARRVEELGQVQEKGAPLQQRVLGDAREALRYTLAQAAEVRNIWQATLAHFQDGLEGNDARELLQTALSVFNSWFDLAASTRDLCQTAGRAGLTRSQEWLDELEVAHKGVEGLRLAAGQMHDFLNHPRSPIDPGVLERARQAIAQGRFKNPETIRARSPKDTPHHVNRENE